MTGSLGPFDGVGAIVAPCDQKHVRFDQLLPSAVQACLGFAVMRSRGNLSKQGCRVHSRACSLPCRN